MSDSRKLQRNALHILYKERKKENYTVHLNVRVCMSTYVNTFTAKLSFMYV